jgi:hypothetical protein
MTGGGSGGSWRARNRAAGDVQATRGEGGSRRWSGGSLHSGGGKVPCTGGRGGAEQSSVCQRKKKGGGSEGSVW